MFLFRFEMLARVCDVILLIPSHPVCVCVYGWMYTVWIHFVWEKKQPVNKWHKSNTLPIPSRLISSSFFSNSFFIFHSIRFIGGLNVVLSFNVWIFVRAQQCKGRQIYVYFTFCHEPIARLVYYNFGFQQKKQGWTQCSEYRINAMRPILLLPFWYFIEEENSGIHPFIIASIDQFSFLLNTC